MLIGHVRWLLENGCDGVAPLGTTGEANSLSLQDRMAAIEAIAAAGISPDRVVVGTGGCALGDTLAVTRQAIDLGFPNALALVPSLLQRRQREFKGELAHFLYCLERAPDGVAAANPDGCGRLDRRPRPESGNLAARGAKPPTDGMSER